MNKGEILKTVLTDDKGKYSVTVEPSKQYTGIQVINQFFVDPTLSKKFLGYEAYFNGQLYSQCCSAPIGQKTEYNFILFPK